MPANDWKKVPFAYFGETIDPTYWRGGNQIQEKKVLKRQVLEILALEAMTIDEINVFLEKFFK